MILNATLCDYLRLTTFNPITFKDFCGMFRRHAKAGAHKQEDAVLMQYSGKRTSHGWLMTGKQRQGYHFLTQYSGAPAHLALVDALDQKLDFERCTRLDVQLTIPLPDDYSSLQLFDSLNGNVPYGRSVTLWKSGDGLDTVYIGRLTTKNGRVTRIYVKEYAGGRGLRFETQFNGNHADQHWQYVKRGGSLESLLVMELESLGDVDVEPLATFYGLVSGSLPAPRPTAVETSTPTLDWLLNTCDPVIRRMLNDHDHGWKVRHWLELLLDWS